MKSPSPRGGARKERKPRDPALCTAVPPDPWWLDEPIRPVSGRGYGRRLNPRLAWFTDRLAPRARALLYRAACGELQAQGRGTTNRDRVPPVRTVREFIALPTLLLILQPRYGYVTHLGLCRAFRANGVTGVLFSGDENELSPYYPYVPNRVVTPAPGRHGPETDQSR